MNLVELPTHSVKDIAGGLRRLADEIENGKYLDAYNVVWIVDCGKARIEFGMLGPRQDFARWCYEMSDKWEQWPTCECGRIVSWCKNDSLPPCTQP